MSQPYAPFRYHSAVLKINASKHKCEIRISQKPLGFSKNAFSKSFLEFYLVYNRFWLKSLQSKLQKLHFWSSLAQIGRFSMFDLLDNVSRQSLHSKNFTVYLEATDMF